MAEKAWRVLRDHPDIEFKVLDLPAGIKAIYAQRGEDVAILVDKGLSPAERLAAVAHELIHHERGGGCHHPDAPPLLHVATKREERRVELAVVEGMVDWPRLRRFVDQRAEIGMVFPLDVAEEFDLALDVADLALRRLASGF